MQAQFDPDSTAAWQVRIFKKSAPRQAVLDHIQRLLPPLEGLSCLDIGGRDGVIPYMLRRNGGRWISADTRPAAVNSMRAYFGEDEVVALSDFHLPFEDDGFDLIVVMEHLERLRDDAGFLRECHRCLRTGGELILHAPREKSFSMVRGIRNLLGLTDEAYGRVRPGYRLHDLYEISKNGFDIVENDSYGGFLEEFIETWIVKSTGGARVEEPELLAPPDSAPDHQVLRRYAHAYRIHALLYPVVKLARGLDHLFGFTCNHHWVVKLKRRPWNERRGVRMRDGRSIADATINTKIGSAADMTDPKNQ